MSKSRNVGNGVLEKLHRNGGIIGISAIGPPVSQKLKPTIDGLVQ